MGSFLLLQVIFAISLRFSQKSPAVTHNSTFSTSFNLEFSLILLWNYKYFNSHRLFRFYKLTWVRYNFYLTRNARNFIIYLPQMTQIFTNSSFFDFYYWCPVKNKAIIQTINKQRGDKIILWEGACLFSSTFLTSLYLEFSLILTWVRYNFIAHGTNGLEPWRKMHG